MGADYIVGARIPCLLLSRRLRDQIWKRHRGMQEFFGSPCSDAARLFRLHAKACRLAETRPGLIRTIRRSLAPLSKKVLYAFVNCLKSDKSYKNIARQGGVI